MQSLPAGGPVGDLHLARRRLRHRVRVPLATGSSPATRSRATQLALVAANYDAEPVPLAELIPAGRALDPGDQWHPVRLTGDVSRRRAAARAQSPARRHRGLRGARAVPARRRPGDPRSTAAGCPRASDQPEPDAVPAPPEGEVTVIARLRPGEALPSSGRSAPEGQVPTINLGLDRRRHRLRRSARRSSRAPTALMVSEDPAPATQPNRARGAVRGSRAAPVVRDPVDPVRDHGLRLHRLRDPHRASPPARGRRGRRRRMPSPARRHATPASRSRRRSTRTPSSTPRTLRSGDAGGQARRDQVRVVATPDVFDAVRQDEDALGVERLDGALVVRDEHDRALVVRRARRGSLRARRGRGCSSARRAAACWRSRRRGSRARGASSRRPRARRRA